MLKKWLCPAFNRPFSKAQFAFVPNVRYGGCCNALTLARIWTLRSLDEGADYVRWLAIDFRKAFDSVSHKNVLLTLAEHFQISCPVIAWLYDYFVGRMQRVVMDSTGSSASPFISCTSGVPQGSVLGPVLFAVLLDPCLSQALESKLICYADDCTIMSRVFPNGTDSLQGDANLFIQTAESLGLDLNPEKCQVISFTSRRSISTGPPRPPSTIVLNNVPLSPVTRVKILGVWFTEDLKWDYHCDYVYNKCARSSHLVRLLRLKGCRGPFLSHICDSLVLSHLVYCWPVFCDCNNKNLSKFLSLQRRLAALCGNSSLWGDLRSRLDHQCINLARSISRIEDHPLQECFQRRTSHHSMVLRNQSQFLPLPAKKAALKKSFTKFAC